MKLSAAAAIAATAALVQVGAAPTPLRLLVISSTVQEDVSPIAAVRFGHSVGSMPVAPNRDYKVVNFPHPPPGPPPPVPPIPGVPHLPPHSGLPPPPPPEGKIPVPPRRFRHRPGCGGRRAKAMVILEKFRLKAIEVSNTIRLALGLPLIEIHHPHPHHRHHHHHHHHDHHNGGKDESKSQEAPGGIRVDGGFVSILPFPQPNHDNGNWVPVKASEASEAPSVPPQDDQARRHRHWHGHRHRGSFFSRLHRSLMNLGRWEGRTVAFVIGCGIGVLLRMFWVLGIVAYRAFRGDRDDGYVAVTVMEEYDSDDGETVVSAPPTPKLAEPPKYTYPVDEKLAAEQLTK